MTKVLVELDLSEGLLDGMEIVWNKWNFHQINDYWEFPFRCAWCHEFRYLQVICSSIGKDLVSFNQVQIQNKVEGSDAISKGDVGTRLQ